ncbi:MAG: GNAT family N-acetyltransferase [Eubacterium sp.]|nr:GNAT family N-acetyltransferase [Candidatus Colimonas fimequi]
MFRKVKVPTLEGDKVILRMWNRKDAADLYEYACDPRVGPSAGWYPHRSVQESRTIIDTVYLSRIDWAIIDKESGKAVGNIGFDDDVIRQNVNSRELGYSLSADYWGRGLTTEAVILVTEYAFTTLGVDTVTMRISPDNTASRRVAEKAGFVYEGILRNSYRQYNNSIVDMACYSMLESDYFGYDRNL